MKILVTGGAGFIGSHVVDGYIAEGHEVVVVDNLYTGRLENLNPGAVFYLMDVRSEDMQKVFEIERPEIVNHHASQISVPESVANPRLDADINIMGLLNLLENCVRFSVKRFIFSSTGGAVYGETEVIPTPEETPPQPLSPYAITKLCSENYIRFYGYQYGLNYCILRYANIYGPRQIPHTEAGVVSIFINALKRNEIPTVYHYPEEPDGMTRDYCYVKDVVRANILALNRGDSEVINIGTSVETTTGELYRTILGIIREYGFAKEERFLSPGKGPARPGDLRRSALANKKAREVLGWSPGYDLYTGLKETILEELKHD